VLALSTLASTAALWLFAQRLPGLTPALRRSTDVLAFAAAAQVSLGVATLLHAVPVWLGSAHQAGALTLFSIALFTLHSLRVPSAKALAPRLAAAAAKAPRPVAVASANDAKLAAA
jgi:cytochrome c oxidase assembly protein subunit 15